MEEKDIRPFQGDLNEYFNDWKALRRTELERGMFIVKTKEIEEAGFPVVKTEKQERYKLWLGAHKGLFRWLE